MRRAVWVQTKAWHVFAADPPNCKSDSELWENRLIGAVFFFDVAKPVDILWIDELIYELRTLIFPSYLVKAI